MRWLNLRYFEAFGRFYQPLIKVIHRYNHRERVAWYHQRPEWLTTELYRDFRAHPPDGAGGWNGLLDVNGPIRSFPHGVRVSVALLNQRKPGDGAW